MPRIPEYHEQYRYAGRAGNLGGRLHPGDHGGAAGAVGASGRIAGQARMRAGAALSKAADTAAAIYDDHNTVKARQAVNELQKNFLAWQSEMSRDRGEAGMDAGARYEQWQERRTAELVRGMNDIQRGRFNAMAEMKTAGFRKWAEDYGSEQGLAYRNAEDMAGIKTSGEVLTANLAEPAIAEPALDSIRKSAESIASRKGLGEEARALFIRNALSGTLAPAIAAQIDAGRLSTAHTALLHYRDEIGVADAMKLRAAILREGRRLEAAADAERERAETRSALGGVASLLRDTEGMSRDERKAAVMEALAREPDPGRRRKMESAAMGELAFQDRRLAAQNAAAGRALAEKAKDMSPVERSEFFLRSGASREAMNNAVKLLSSGMTTDPVALSRAREEAAGGMDMDEISARYATLINAKDMEGLRSFAADEEQKKANRRRTAFFAEMTARSGLDPKDEDDKTFLAGIRSELEEKCVNGEFKSEGEQRGWIYEKLARRRAPGWFFGETEYSPREALGRKGAYIPVPPREADDIARQLVMRGVDNPTPRQIQDVYDAQTGMGRRRPDRDDD